MIAYRPEVVEPIRVTHLTPRVEASEPEKSKEGMRHTLELDDKVSDDSDTKNIKYEKQDSKDYKVNSTRRLSA